MFRNDFMSLRKYQFMSKNWSQLHQSLVPIISISAKQISSQFSFPKQQEQGKLNSTKQCRMKKSCIEFLAPVCCLMKTRKPKTLTSKQQLGKYANMCNIVDKFFLRFVEWRNDLISGLSDLPANNCDFSFYSNSNRYCNTICLRHCVPVRTSL